MTAVVGWTNIAVELAVIHVRQPFLELRRLLFQPVRKTVSDFIDLCVCQLNALSVAHLDVVAVVILADALHHVGAGVVKRMFQQGNTVIRAVVAMHTELFRNLHVLLAASHRELIHTLRVADADVRTVELGHIGRKDARWNPTLTEVEVKVGKLDAFWEGRFDGFQRLHHARIWRIFLPVGLGELLLLFQPVLNVLSLLDDIASDESVFYLVVPGQRIVVDMSLQPLDKFILRHADEISHIVQFHTTVLVERSRQGFLRGIDLRHLVDVERNRMVEDVRLNKLAVLHALNGKGVTTVGIHQQQLGHLPLVQVPEVLDKLVIKGVQFLAQFSVFLMVVRLVGVECFVGVTHRDVCRQPCHLRCIQLQRMEGSAILRHTAQVSEVAVLIQYDGAVTIERLHIPVERLGRKVNGFLCLWHTDCLCLSAASRLSADMVTAVLLHGLLGGKKYRVHGVRQPLTLQFSLSVFLGNDTEFDSLFRCHVHHHLIETVDGWILFPINVSVDVIRIVGQAFLLFLLSLVHVEGSREIQRQCLLNHICILFPGLWLRLFLCFLLGLFHHLSLRYFLTVLFPEVEQAEHRGRGCRFLWLFLFVGLGFLNWLLFFNDHFMLFRFY